MDNCEPIVEYAKTLDNLEFIDNAIGAKEVLIDHFGRNLWFEVMKRKAAGGLDADNDGSVTKVEVARVVHELWGEDIGQIMVDNLFGT